MVFVCIEWGLENEYGGRYLFFCPLSIGFSLGLGSALALKSKFVWLNTPKCSILLKRLLLYIAVGVFVFVF